VCTQGGDYRHYNALHDGIDQEELIEHEEIRHRDFDFLVEKGWGKEGCLSDSFAG
jgi:hypothetical protein